MRTAIATLVLLLAFVATAFADEPAVEQAKKDVASGLEAQGLGRYDDAIAFYKKAYDAVPHPDILFNLGQAHRLKGDLEAALVYYKRYVSVVPKGRVSNDARKWIAKLEKATATRAEEAKKAEEARKAEEAKKAEEARKAEEAKKAEGGAGAGKSSPTNEPRPEPHGPGAKPNPRPPSTTPISGPAPDPGRTQRDNPPSRGRTLKIAGIATGTAGVIGIALGIKFGVDASNISSELSDHTGPWTDDLLAKQSEGKRDQVIMYVGIGLGAGAVAAGATLFMMGRKKDREASTVVGAAPLPEGGAAVLVRGAF